MISYSTPAYYYVDLMFNYVIRANNAKKALNESTEW